MLPPVHRLLPAISRVPLAFLVALQSAYPGCVYVHSAAADRADSHERHAWALAAPHNHRGDQRVGAGKGAGSCAPAQTGRQHAAIARAGGGGRWKCGLPLLKWLPMETGSCGQQACISQQLCDSKHLERTAVFVFLSHGAPQLVAITCSLY